MTALLLAFALSFLASIAIESRPPNLSALRAPWTATLLRALLHLALYSAAFSLSWRPWHAAFVVCVTAFLFGTGSAMKKKIIGEPVVFSDFALVRNAIRHPRLYYAEKLAEPRALALFAAIAVATAIWFALEPPSPAPELAWLVVPPLVCLAAIAALRSAPASRTAAALVGPGPRLDHDIARFGLGGAMTLHWLAWRGQARPSAEARVMMEAVPRPAPGAPRSAPAVVVAIQCESFVDVAARGAPGPDLPAYRALSREAAAFGRCEVPAAEGAYTMRTEFGFLTGLPSAALGFDVFDPYLVTQAYASASIARKLRQAGWRTVFIHPYDRRFFARDEFVPELGFDRFLDERDFEGAARVGPYIGDLAVADRIAAEIAGAEGPTFIFAVTIENHGPWGPGRLPGIDDPARQYALHLENTDRMLGRVADALRRVEGGAILAAYGDHAPARSVFPDLPDRTAADYLVWDSRAVRPGCGARIDQPIDAVGRLTLERAGLG